MPYHIPGMPSAAPPVEEVPPEPATASEGVHPLAVSPEEGQFAAPPDQIVAQCQKLLTLKYTTMLTYINYGDRIRAHFRDSVYEHWKEHTEDERKDAYALVMKITAMGGEPDVKIKPVPSLVDLHQMILTVLKLEQLMLAETRTLVAMAGENIGLKVMAEQFALTDSHHADDARRMFFCESGA